MGQVQADLDLEVFAIAPAAVRSETATAFAVAPLFQRFRQAPLLIIPPWRQLTDDGILRSESLKESRMAVDERRLETVERALDERRHDFVDLKAETRKKSTGERCLSRSVWPGDDQNRRLAQFVSVSFGLM